MQPYHRQSVDALAGCTVKISKPRDTAPCLVQCKLYMLRCNHELIKDPYDVVTMPEQFPQVIQVTLISAVNVDPHHDEIYWPDRTGFVIDDLDPTLTVKQMDTHIRFVWLVICKDIGLMHAL